ncbi:hypothetical protein ACFIN9_37795 [Streptomyces noursei]
MDASNLNDVQPDQPLGAAAAGLVQAMLVDQLEARHAPAEVSPS